MAQYMVDSVVEDGDDDQTWEAHDWAYIVKDGNEILCICATEEEAAHIAELLNEKPYRA